MSGINNTGNFTYVDPTESVVGTWSNPSTSTSYQYNATYTDFTGTSELTLATGDNALMLMPQTLGENAEITIEVNPGTVTREKLMDYKKAGINRLSIGLQSTDNDTLKRIGRIHSYEDFVETYDMAREIGFDNINVDFMIALPGEEEWSVAIQISEIIN